MRNKFIAAIIAACLLSIGLVGSSTAASAAEVTQFAAGNGQETCPNTGGGWVKFDGLTGTTFTIPDDKGEGWSIDQVCYKSSTTVVYIQGTGWVVTSTVTNQNGNVQNLSHVSVHFVYTPKPDDLVTYTDWVDGTYVCLDTTVTQTRTKTVTTYSWDTATHTWVANEPVVTEETQVRDLTEQEMYDACRHVDVNFTLLTTAATCDAAEAFVDTFPVVRDGYTLTVAPGALPGEWIITATADTGVVFNGEGNPTVRTLSVFLAPRDTTSEVCIPDIGGRTIGFWTNKNGTAAGAPIWNAAKAGYSNAIPSTMTFAQAQTALKVSGSTNLGKDMLRAQFIATALNVQYIDGYGAQHITVPSTSAILPGEVVTVTEYLAAVNAGWASLDTKDEITSVKNVLDAINQDVASDLFV